MTLIPEPAAQAFCHPAAELDTACPRSSEGKTEEEVHRPGHGFHSHVVQWHQGGGHEVRELVQKWIIFSDMDYIFYFQTEKKALTGTINTLSEGFVTIETEEAQAHETYYKWLPSYLLAIQTTQLLTS